MNLNDYFKSENKDLIFVETSFGAEFIAEVNDSFTEYMDADVFTRDWAFQFLPLRSYFVHSEKNPLQLLTFESIERAEKEAMKYSKSGYKVAVLAWYADFDMY